MAASHHVRGRVVTSKDIGEVKLVRATSRSTSSFEDGRSSYSSYDSRSSTSTSSPLARSRQRQGSYEDGAPLSYTHTHENPSASVQTYDSVFSETETIDELMEGDEVDALPPPVDDAIPDVLPPYRASIIDPLVRPSTPDAFAQLFPSLDRLSIRHDDLTPDGNMNLRVDIVVPRKGATSRPVTVQLFHLRMHDLARREFSLRRYCRESGREVCNSRRAYAEPSPTSRPGFQHSLSSVIRSVKTSSRRFSNASNHSKRPSTGNSSGSSTWDNTSVRSMRMRTDSWTSDKPPPPASILVPTNSIKLEFSNYARVDVTRKGGHDSKHYAFDWWGHTYSWRRVIDKNLDVAAFHLIRDGHGAPIAHITPEMRSPNQIEADKDAGGWIPPCHMWISDPSVLDAITDVAE
jgi:hypothetical protein